LPIFASAVGDTIMPSAFERRNGNPAHGSVSVTFTVSGSTTVVSLIVVSTPARIVLSFFCRSMLNLTASAL
jgi:hypothetical protein